MSALTTRGGRLAIAVAAALVVVIGLAAAGAFGACGSSGRKGGRPSAAVSSSAHGGVAHATAVAFARSVHPRVADTWGEIKGREFIAGAFQQYGYFPRTQEFIARTGRRRVHSANVIAVKEGESPAQLVIGAHYDSVAAGEGYSDNATGVGLLLEAAARIKGRRTPYTLVFIAFGAEEQGSLGAQAYLDAASGLDRRAIIGMIDLDAVAGGDDLSVMSRVGEPTWLRDDALGAAHSLGIDLGTSPRAPGRAAGTMQAPSDDLVFVDAGYPTAVFSAVSWEGSRGTHMAATSELPGLWHSPDDTVARIEKTFPGRVRRQLGNLSRVLEELLTSELEREP